MSATGRNPRGGGGADFFATPSWCVDRLLESADLPAGKWLEPAAGDGAIVHAVNARGASDIDWQLCELRPECRPQLEGLGRVTVGDFLSANYERDSFDVVITNPPFSLAEKFIRKALLCAPYVAMLLRLNFLGSAERHLLFWKHMPDVYVLPNRPSFTGRGTDSTEYCWMVWQPSIRPAQIKVLNLTSREERCGGKKEAA